MAFLELAVLWQWSSALYREETFFNIYNLILSNFIESPITKNLCILSKQNVKQHEISKHRRDTCSHSRYFFSLLTFLASCLFNQIFRLKLALYHLVVIPSPIWSVILCKNIWFIFLNYFFALWPNLIQKDI